ncbi:MAG: putative selenate reductase subunit YgfK [Candidatus Cloacimonadota bacterium]|nr:putative selenate reductase subunit YgfK [Candidatus Cloacimonadota bacterium]
MSDVMKPIPFKKLLDWILQEYRLHKTIFGIPKNKYFQINPDHEKWNIFDSKCSLPIGPAAGPHTQSTQNIVAAYLTGSRYFELKTVQILDEIDIDKPCIEAENEGYNTEWSTELTVKQAYEEYVKAWFLIHLLSDMLNLEKGKPQIIFNLSVGYDLKGIKSEKIDNFIEDLKDASQNPVFRACRKILAEYIDDKKIPGIFSQNFIKNIPVNISNSITLSTMHGCPPDEQEAICKYLLEKKKMHTYVKLNPTLLGYKFVTYTFQKLGFTNIKLKKETFTNDLQYSDAVQMIKELHNFAKKFNLQFGLKLSNTLPVINKKQNLPGDEMYMSGNALRALTLNLADKLNQEFQSNVPISYAGGVNYFLIKKIIQAGLYPITFATDLLKPGGYTRIAQEAKAILEETRYPQTPVSENISRLARESLQSKYLAEKPNLKLPSKLDIFDCFVAPCQQNCPIGQDVPDYIEKLNQEKYREALQIILARNPLPHITGFICEQPCALKCVRYDYEEPIMIRGLKRIAAEKGYNNLQTEKITKNNKKPVAIFGAGPCGLATAYFLAKAGYNIKIFEKRGKAGGMVQYVIPSFRLPAWAIERDINILLEHGVEIETNSTQKINITELKEQGFGNIVLAIGAWKSRTLNLEGDTEDLMEAITFLQTFKINPPRMQLGKNVAVIGGGNSAMDSARAALKVNGVENVYLIYRRTKKQMPADPEEFKNALKDGADFRELLNPISLRDGKLICQKMKLGKKDASGRAKPVPIPNEKEIFAVNTVISAIGEIVDYDLLKKAGVQIDKNGDIVPEFSPDSDKKEIFVGGDAFRGPSSVVEAMADGQNIARNIMKKDGFDPQPFFEHNIKTQPNLDNLQNRRGVLQKAWQLDSNSKIIAETERCFECKFLCNKCVEVCPNRANVAISVPNMKDENQILHLDALCNECGNCETFCPHNGAPYKDKFTLFQTKQDFENSDNSGFLPLVNDNKFLLRLVDEEISINIKKPETYKHIASEYIKLITSVMKNYSYLL